MMATQTPVFHSVRGENVKLSADSRIATRERGFDRGLCALSTPLSDFVSTPTSGPSADIESPQQRIQLLVTQTQAELSGGLGLGVSARRPADLTRATLPTSAASARKGWAFTKVPQSSLAIGTQIAVWLDARAREVCYETTPSDAQQGLAAASGAEEETSGELALDDAEILDSLDTNSELWLYVDVYGFVKEVKILAQGDVANLSSGVADSENLPNIPAESGSFHEEGLQVRLPGTDDDCFVQECATFIPEGRKAGKQQSGGIHRQRETNAERRRKARWANQQLKKTKKEAQRQADKDTRVKDQARITAIKIEGVVVKATLGDISEATTEGVINPTNVELDLAGRVSESLCNKGGQRIKDECKAQNKMVNDVFISGSGDLMKQGIKWIVHVRAPRDEKDCESILKSGLVAAAAKGIKTISIPMIGTGAHGRKPEEMTRAIVRACCEFARTQGAPRKIEKLGLVGFSNKGYTVFVDELTKVANSLPPDCKCRETFEQIPLDADSEEYERVAKLFTEAKVLQTELVGIYRTKAPYLENKFNAHKDQLKNQYQIYKEILDKLECEVFHGTTEQTTTKILSGGFNPKFGAQDPARTVYGQGCYFARELVKSAHDDYAKPNDDGHKFVFVVRLLVGAAFNTLDYHNPKENKLLVSPPLNDDTGYCFDTGVWPIQKPSVYVTFHTDQALPLYLLVLKKTNLEQPAAPIKNNNQNEKKGKKSFLSRICPVS